MQNMYSHYRKIQTVEPFINFQLHNQTLPCFRDKLPLHPRKYELERSLEVEKNNKILYRNLLDIRKRKSTTFENGGAEKKKGKT